MMRRRIALLLLLAFFALPLWLFFAEGGDAAGRFAPLAALAPALRRALGEPTQNGRYLADGMLIEPFAEPDGPKTRAHTDMLARLADMLTERYEAQERAGVFGVRRIPVYFMLVPTAESVKADALPRYAAPFDQKRLINTLYFQSGLPGVPALNTVRAYEALERAGSRAVFYRSEPSLTGLGGYYLYQELAASMRLTPEELGRFRAVLADGDYHADPAARVQPDTVMLYTYADELSEQRVIHYDGVDRRFDNALHPAYRRELGGTDAVILGGESPRIDILTASSREDSLLILGDRTVASYIGFLTVHFNKITVLDVATVDEALMQGVDVGSYHRILIGLSLDTYVRSDTLLDAMKLIYYRALDPSVIREEDMAALPESPTPTLESPPESGPGAAPAPQAP